MNNEVGIDEGQVPTKVWSTSRRRENMETLVIVGVLIFYFALMRWILPRMGVPT